MVRLVLQVHPDLALQVRQVLVVLQAYLAPPAPREPMGQMAQLALQARRLLFPDQRVHLLLARPAQPVLLLVWLAQQALAAQPGLLDRLVRPLQ